MKLTISMLAVTLALILYTIAVFSEIKAGKLTKRHSLLFWAGLIFNTIGTGLMVLVSNSSEAAAQTTAYGIHGVTGFLATALMLFHAIMASVTCKSDNEKKKENFHKKSISIWIFWLIPYLIGMIMAISN